MEFSDLPLFSGVPELVAKMVDPNLPDVPSRERVAAFLEAGGWLRATAGDGDFDAACNAVAEVIRLGRGLYVWGAAGCGGSSATMGRIPCRRRHSGSEWCSWSWRAQRRRCGASRGPSRSAGTPRRRGRK